MASNPARDALGTAAFLGALLLASGCDSPTSEPPALQLWATVGDQQLGEIESTLERPLLVRVTDSQGRAAQGVAIDWAVGVGGGSLNTGESSFRTNASGNAWVYLTLGPHDGTQTVVATAHGNFDVPTVTFTATAVSLLVGTIAAGRPDYYCWYSYSCLDFDPMHVTTAAGSTIGWKWPGLHNITFEDAPTQPASSPTIDTGTHLRLFSEPGTYRYRCTLHSTDFEEGMVGSVTVQ
jgi:hypothetical protein